MILNSNQNAKGENLNQNKTGNQNFDIKTRQQIYNLKNNETSKSKQKVSKVPKENELKLTKKNYLHKKDVNNF